MTDDLAVHLARAEEAPAWEAYVDAHPSAVSYHAWGWLGVFERAFGHEPVPLVAVRGNRVVGVLPLVFIRSLLFGRSMTSLPFVNYGGVIADDAAVARALVDAAGGEARARRCRHVELRHVGRQFQDLPARTHKVTMHLSLADGLWDRFDRKVRNQVRKAVKSGLEATRGGVELLDEFYAVFARNMRDLGTPVYTRALFREVLETFPGRAHLVLVRAGRQAVAGGLSFRTRDVVEVPWASSIREFNPQCPNHLLYWTIIQSAMDEGCRTLDFGRSTPNEGTYRFKAQWGAGPVPLAWEYLLLDGGEVPDQGPTNPKFRLAIAAWQKLPLWFANAAGPSIVKGIP